MTLGVMATFRELQIAIPEEVALVGRCPSLEECSTHQIRLDSLIRGGKPLIAAEPL